MRAERLTGAEMGELQALFATAFARSRFEQLLLHRLDQHLENLVGPADDYRTALRKVIDEANRELWWLDLLAAARHALPADPGLQSFGRRFEVGPAIVAGGEVDDRRLELQIRQARSAFNVAQWRARLGEIEGRVCRIEYPTRRGTATGTGFLVGPEVVLTNYHVVESVITKAVDPAAVVVRFDYRYDAEPGAPAMGTEHSLAADWLLASSPYSGSDLDAGADDEPDPDELDLALLTVAGRPGEQPVGGPTDDPAVTTRGWLTLPATDYDFGSSPALHIVQHPAGQALSVVLDTEAVIGVNRGGTRVRYRTNTEPGSSGSPCFGPDWEWIAVHHSGDPAYRAEGLARYNQGIPVSALRGALARWDLGGALGL